MRRLLAGAKRVAQLMSSGDFAQEPPDPHNPSGGVPETVNPPPKQSISIPPRRSSQQRPRRRRNVIGRRRWVSRW